MQDLKIRFEGWPASNQAQSKHAKYFQQIKRTEEVTVTIVIHRNILELGGVLLQFGCQLLFSTRVNGGVVEDCTVKDATTTSKKSL